MLDSPIVTIGPKAYRRPDGIAVIPAALLGPRNCRRRSERPYPRLLHRREPSLDNRRGHRAYITPGWLKDYDWPLVHSLKTAGTMSTASDQAKHKCCPQERDWRDG